MNKITLHITGAAKRYTDAYTVATVTVGIGNAIKVIGFCGGGVIMLISGLCAFNSWQSMEQAIQRSDSGIAGFSMSVIGVAGVCLGAIVGLILFVFGVLVVAQGQTLKATLDSAVNSSPFLLDEERAKVMSLQVVQTPVSRPVPPPLPA